MHIFVYGSLKRGFSKHQLMEGSELICRTRTREYFAMIDLHYFPGVLRDSQVSPIYGEVYDINSELLGKLDDYEGDWYYREHVELESGFIAWMYFLRKVPCSMEKYATVTEGVWREKSVENENA